jgi:hypothetical protein
MAEMLSDHAIGVTGLILGIVGILASYYFYLKAREKVDLRYSLNHRPILRQRKDSPQRISFMLNGVLIEKLSRCDVVVWNRGSRTLAGSDISPSDPLAVSFPAGVAILDVNVYKQTRHSIQLSAAVRATERRVTIAFDYLDKGDGGAIEILYQQEEESGSGLHLTGSIRGLPEGPRRPSLRGLQLTFDDDDHEDGSDDDGDHDSRRGWVAPTIFITLLVLLTGLSYGLLSLTHPATVVLLTITSEALLVAVIFGTVGLYFWQRIRSANLPKFPDRDE